MNREQLLERQYQLLRCLVAGGTDPEGMPARRLRIVSRGLACKRRREAISSWPGLAAGGELVEGWFDQYAATHQRPPGGSPLLDGYGFCLWLAERGNPLALHIISQCRPYREGVVARPVWERHWIRWNYALRHCWRRQYPEYTLKRSLPATS